MIWSGTIDNNRWIAIFKANKNPTRALAMVTAAMCEECDSGAEVFIFPQDDNERAAEILGDRDLIGWTYWHTSASPE